MSRPDRQLQVAAGVMLGGLAALPVGALLDVRELGWLGMACVGVAAVWLLALAVRRERRRP